MFFKDHITAVLKTDHEGPEWKHSASSEADVIQVELEEGVVQAGSSRNRRGEV